MGSPPAEPLINAKKSGGGSGRGGCTAGGALCINGTLAGVCVIAGESDGVSGARCSARSWSRRV